MSYTSLHIHRLILKHLFMTALIHHFLTMLIIHPSSSLYPSLGFPQQRKCFLEERKVFLLWSTCITLSLQIFL